MTTTSVTAVTLVQAATMLATHLADHTLPEPAYLRVNTHHGHSEVAAQLHATTLGTVATDLLAWATTLPTVTGEAWRVRIGDRVHLSIASTLTGPAGAIELDVFGAVDYDLARSPTWRPVTGARYPWANCAAGQPSTCPDPRDDPDRHPLATRGGPDRHPGWPAGLRPVGRASRSVRALRPPGPATRTRRTPHHHRWASGVLHRW